MVKSNKTNKKDKDDTMKLKSKKQSKKKPSKVQEDEKEAPPPAVDISTDEEDSVYDSDEYVNPDYYGNEDRDESDDDDDDDDDDGDDDDEEEDEFEDQGSSDEDEDLLEKQQQEQEEEDGWKDSVEAKDFQEASYEQNPRQWNKRKTADLLAKKAKEALSLDGKDKKQTKESPAAWMHTDDLSSDDEDAEGLSNRIGRVPLHWYDEYDHIGYDVHGTKIGKSASITADRVDQAIARADNREQGKFIVHDALNDKNVELTERQLQLVRRVQAGAYAHPEFDGNPDLIDYYSSIPEISGLHSNVNERKARFQPSQWEKLQVERLLEKLEKGTINMDYLTGKIRDMKEVRQKNNPDSKAPFLLWKGDEEDLLNTRKGPQHIAAPKLRPPGHAESYRPPEEYIPSEEEVKEWEDMELKDRPHGRLVPKQFPNLRSVGAYEHTVTETFERCLDLYLCPRVMKRRLNIDPESLVPQLPKPQDLKPFPSAKCIEYKTPNNDEQPLLIRCLTVSPDGQFMASGASDGFVRLWEVQTGRLLRSWDLMQTLKTLDGEVEKEEGKDEEGKDESSEQESSLSIKPVVCLEWNPNRSHHCLIAAIGKYVLILATGTGGVRDAEMTAALLASASKGGSVNANGSGGAALNQRTSKAVRWHKVAAQSKFQAPISSHDRLIGVVAAIQTNRDVGSLRWHGKGDYFVSVSPKAGAAAVLIHQLSKGNSQQPFSKAKGEALLACFHPTKPFLFVSNQHHVRIYHLVKQSLVKRLISGCKYISSIDVHPSGDHIIVGSLDRKLIWFDLDLGATPFKSLKYHERGLRAVSYHKRYPLMASSSDDGTVHVFHSMVYSDLMRNPMIIPVKILRGHTISTKKLGVLTTIFHPTQPWLFSGGADGRIFLFQDI